MTQDKIKQEGFYKSIGQSIYKIRKQNNLSQDDFGRLFGISRVAVVNIESGKQRLSIYHYAIICDHFKIDLNDFSIQSLPIKQPEVKQEFGEWISVNPDADIADTDLQHFEQYFIVMAENGQVRQAVFCDWQTEGVDNTWIINDEEYPLTFATHYQRVIYPSPPKSI